MKTKNMTNEQLILEVEELNQQLISGKSQHERIIEQLAVDEEKFSFLFETAPISLIISTPERKILHANKMMQNCLGYTENELIEMDVVDLYAEPNVRDQVLDILYDKGDLRNFEITLKHKYGTHYNTLMSSDFIDYNDQKIIFTSLQDISHIKDIQKNLTMSEKRYRSLFANAPIGITVTDVSGNLLDSNQAIQELLGYSSDELVGKNVIDFYYNKADRQLLLNLTDSLGVVRDFETVWQDKDGEKVYVIINTDVIFLDGQENILLNSIRDITKRKVAEAELAKEHDFINTILDTDASLVVVLNKSKVITMTNKAFANILGYTSEELNAGGLNLVVDDMQHINKELDNLFAGNYPSKFVCNLTAKGGAKRIISWTNSVILDNEDKPEFVICTGSDITEQRKAQVELEEVNEKLVSWVRELEERTEEMTQLREMGEQLQSCQNVEEACTISSQYIQRIYPSSQGALHLINSKKNLAELAVAWGEKTFSESVFEPMDCWAIRRGRFHLVNTKHPGLICKHLMGPQNGEYLCVPILANGEVMGTIHLYHNQAKGQSGLESKEILFNEHRSEFLITISESIALALANLKLKETLHLQSICDPLTGLFNRRYMEESLARDLRRAKREKKPVGLMMFDIDHFKDFNDLLGHDAGDALLRELGSLFKRCIRGGDMVCRFGGEEFVSVLPGATLEITWQRAEELRQSVREMLIYHLGKPLDQCTISIGIAAYPDHGEKMEELIKKADTALYRAKEEGRDRVKVAK